MYDDWFMFLALVYTRTFRSRVQWFSQPTILPESLAVMHK